MARLIEATDSFSGMYAVPAIYLFAEASSVCYKTMRSRAARIAAKINRLPKDASFRDWTRARLPGESAHSRYIEPEVHHRTGLRDLVVYLKREVAGGDDRATGICVVGNYEQAFGNYDQRAVVEFFRSFKIRLIDASRPDRKHFVPAQNLEVKLVPPSATYRTDKQKFGRLKAAITRELRGTRAGKKPVRVGSEYQTELHKTIRHLARRPRRVLSKTGTRLPQNRASYAKIAGALNKLGIRDPGGEPWTRRAVHRYIKKHLPSLLDRRTPCSANRAR